MVSNEALISAIKYINTLRSSGKAPHNLTGAERVFDLLFSAGHTLAVYGSLMPGKENHHLISDIEGAWETGHVYGKFQDGGWGWGLGYPSVIWDPAGDAIPVRVLVSKDLPVHFDRLDRFEGDGYVRILAPVYQSGKVRWVANIYESATKEPG